LRIEQENEVTSLELKMKVIYLSLVKEGLKKHLEKLGRRVEMVSASLLTSL